MRSRVVVLDVRFRWSFWEDGKGASGFQGAPQVNIPFLLDGLETKFGDELFGMRGQDVIMPLVRGAMNEGRVFGQTVIVVDDESQVGHRFTALVGHSEWVAGFMIGGIDIGYPAKRGKGLSRGWKGSRGK